MAPHIGRLRAHSESTSYQPGPSRSLTGSLKSKSKQTSNETYSVTPPSSYRGMRLLDGEQYPKASVFKSPELTIKINSPSAQVIRRSEGPDFSLPIFGDHDHIPGSVTLDPQNCASDCGRLTLTLEGAFEYISPMSATKAGPSQITPGKHRHVFYHDSAVIPLYVSSEPPSRPTFRSAIATIRRVTSSERIVRPSIKKARSMEMGSLVGRRDLSIPSKMPAGSQTEASRVSWSEASDTPSSTPSAAPRTFNFAFELPEALHAGDELPPTFASSNVVSAGVRGRVYAENADIKYRVRALWEALDGSGSQAQLEAPILFQPDTDFQSLDGFSVTPESWSETPLSRVDSLPIECAVTMPNPASFHRRTSIPYFVVFTTSPRSRTLAAEIMADATIAVSLVRRVSFDKPTRGLVVNSSSNAWNAKGKERSGLSTGALRSVASSSDLGVAHRKNARGPLPPIPRLDTSPAIIALHSSGSHSPSSPQSAGVPGSASPSTSVEGREKDTEKTRDAISSQRRLLKRVVKSAPPILSGFRLSRADPDSDNPVPHTNSNSVSSSIWRQTEKPLPTIPQESELPLSPTQAQVDELGRTTTLTVSPVTSSTRLTDSRTLHTDVSVGFPKRPKGRANSPGSHPSLETINTLPDGLYKGNIPLQRGWFPSVQWKGLSIEYFLQVSVIFDDAEFKGQVPLRIY